MNAVIDEITSWQLRAPFLYPTWTDWLTQNSPKKVKPVSSQLCGSVGSAREVNTVHEATLTLTYYVTWDPLSMASGTPALTLKPYLASWGVTFDFKGPHCKWSLHGAISVFLLYVCRNGIGVPHRRRMIAVSGDRRYIALLPNRKPALEETWQLLIMKVVEHPVKSGRFRWDGMGTCAPR